MMDFSKYLQKDEKIIRELRPTGKGSTSTNTRNAIAGLLLILAIHISIMVMAHGSNSVVAIIVTSVIFFLFEGLLGYTIIYDLFVKKKVINDDYYCITNKRVLKYDLKKDKLIYGYIVNYVTEIRNLKDGSGDLFMSVDYTPLNNDDPSFALALVKNTTMNPNPTNRPFVCFECIDNVEEVQDLILNLRSELRKEKVGYLCPCCYNSISLKDQTCSSCGFDTNYTAKDVNAETAAINTITKTINTLKLTIIIGVFLIISLIIAVTIYLNNTDYIYFNGILSFINKMRIVTLIIGIIMIITSIILLMTKKIKKILNSLMVFGCGLVIASLLVTSFVKTFSSAISIKDYSKVKTIEIGSEKIPSVYSVLGSRKIVYSDSKTDYYDEESKLKMSYVAIIYYDLSKGDVVKYGNKIKLLNYEEHTKYIDDKMVYSYLKYKTKEKACYSVSINGSTISYGKTNTSCEAFLEYSEEVSN